jgi:hypothetical protein
MARYLVPFDKRFVSPKAKYICVKVGSVCKGYALGRALIGLEAVNCPVP